MYYYRIYILVSISTIISWHYLNEILENVLLTSNDGGISVINFGSQVSNWTINMTLLENGTPL